MGNSKKLLAELFGTFTLVFVGSLAIISAGRIGESVLLVSVGLGFSLALLIGLFAFAEVSGGHFNPAVSLGAFLDGRMPVNEMIGYWVAQIAGAILASLVILIGWDSATVAGTATTYTDAWQAFIVELFLTALFVAVILQVTQSGKYGSFAFVAIPFSLLAIHVAAIPISGSSVNPARSLGPAIVGTEFGDLWLYIVAPLLGGVLGWAAHKVAAAGATTA